MKRKAQSMENSSAKKSHLSNPRDFITSLHETVLSHILSRLPTKDAVRTSILSKDWRYKWTCLYNIDIHDIDAAADADDIETKLEEEEYFIEKEADIHDYNIDTEVVDNDHHIETEVDANDYASETEIDDDDDNSETEIDDGDYNSETEVDVEIDPEVALNQTTFENFVDRVLHHTQKLKSFHIVYRGIDMSRLVTWIAKATKYNLDSLEVTCGVKSIVLPSSLFNGTLLRRVKLHMLSSPLSTWTPSFVPCTLNFAASNSFPNLTSLRLHGVKIQNGNSTTILNFPLLETLVIRECKWLDVTSVEIDAPSLTTFYCETRIYDECSYSIVILGARLATFKWAGWLPPNFIFDGSFVDCTSLKVILEPDDLTLFETRIRQITNRLSGLQELDLYRMSFEMPLVGPPFCQHNNLRRLKLTNDGDGYSGQMFLLELLHMAPLLQYLQITMIEWTDFDYDAIECVPSCLISHLEEVVLIAYGDKITQLYNIAKFFVKNGENLRKVYIGDGNGCGMLKKNMDYLSTLPKVSPCRVVRI